MTLRANNNPEGTVSIRTHLEEAKRIADSKDNAFMDDLSKSIQASLDKIKEIQGAGRKEFNPPLVLTRATMIEMIDASDANRNAGGTGSSVIYARIPDIDGSGDSILEGDGDAIDEEGNGVWIEPDGSRNHG